MFSVFSRAAGQNGNLTSRDQRLQVAFEKEEQAGLRLVLFARFAVLAVLMVWALATARAEYAVVYAGIIAVFGALGALPLFVARIGVTDLRVTGAFLTLDALLLTYVLIVPGAMFPSTLTPQFNLQLPNFLYLCLFLIGMSISYSPLLVLWIGFVSVAAWSAGMLWIVGLPDTLAFTYSELLDPSRFTAADRIEITSSRQFVSLTHWYNRVLFLLLAALVIAVAVWRSRRLAQRQIGSEAARTSLSRYFSPKMVDHLSRSEGSFAEVDNRKIAVLFVDMVGFTRLAERLEPAAVIELLRDFHRRMAELVFAHDGTIDKYIGDALMANFGTPSTGPQDGSNALRCAFAMNETIDSWNSERADSGLPPIEIGIGIHYGDVVTGNIGGDRHLEYAVIGDTVNLASRLEALTRQFECRILVSGQLVDQVRSEGGDAAVLVSRLHRETETTVRGRAQPVEVWSLRQ